MHKYYFMKRFYYLILLFLCACNPQNTSKDITELYVEIHDKKTNISNFIEKVEVIKLETNDQCLIHTISKIIYMNEKFYIFDFGNNALFIFNRDGSCDTILSKIGMGPGEYRRMMDFHVTDNNILLMDVFRSIKKYTYDLKFTNDIELNTFSSQFIVKDDAVFLSNESTGSKDDYYFTVINTCNNDICNYLKMPFTPPDRGQYGGLNTFVINKNTVYASPKFSSIIYNYNNHNFSPKYKIKFNKLNFPEKENIYDYDIYGPNFPYVVKRNFHISDKYLIFDYFYDKKMYHCFYNLSTEELSNGIMNNDLVENFRFFPRWGNDNYLIEEVAAEHVINHFPTLVDLNEQLKDLKEDDNPVIVLYTLKSED